MYVERYVGPEAGKKELARDTQDGLKGLIEVALEVSKLKEFLGRDKPTVITVSCCSPVPFCAHMYPFSVTRRDRPSSMPTASKKKIKTVIVIPQT
jgi:hypothetical protein